MRPITLACFALSFAATSFATFDASADEPSEGAATPEEPVQAPTKPAASESTCSAPQIARAKKLGDGAMVRIESPNGVGAGFVFHSPQHVATAFSLVEAGRGVEVVSPDGNRYEAVVVSYDEAQDLAILKLDRSTSAPPLKLSEQAPNVGSPVLSLAHTAAWGDPETVIHQGIVTADDEPDRFKTDAVESSGFTWGGPLMSCDGEVLGISGSWWTSEATPASHLEATRRVMAPEEIYAGRWSAAHPSVGMVVQVDHGRPAGQDERNVWLGISTGLAVTGYDLWTFPTRLSFMGLVSGQVPNAPQQRTGFRMQAETGVGYRAMLMGGELPMYLVPELGVAMSYDRITTTTRHEFVDLGQCIDAHCDMQTSTTETSDSSFHLMPTAGIGLHMGFAEIGYQFQLDLEEVSQSTHQMTVGFQF